MRRILLSAVLLCSLAALALPGCGGGEASDDQGGAGQGGASAGGGSAGSKPDAGKGGADAAVGGSSGSAGKGGASGAAGAGGSTGAGGNAGAGGAAGQAGMAGSSGQAGSSGTAGAAGSAGSAGEAGAAGSDNDAGVGGAAGEAGAAGASGAAGSSGEGGAAGSSGAGGSGGAVGCALPCHGSDTNAAPPKSLTGKTDPTAPSVGAHQVHLTNSSWHLDVTCDQCHKVPAAADDPAVPTHMNGARDLIWGSVAQSGTYSKPAYTCTGSYCHGGTLEPDIAGKASNRIPTWTVVDGSQSACGANCHTLPPGGAHPASDGCPTCHGSVISSFTPGNPPTVVWANADLHIDGKLAVSNLNCTSCHGDKTTSNPAPPLGTKGETATTQAAVGAHTQHLAPSNWHRAGTCDDCHTTPVSMSHANGLVDFSWGAPGNTGTNPSYENAGLTCSGVYCHGTTLEPAKAGGTVSRTPVWNQVDGSFDACGTTCHTNPPGGTHTASLACPNCHGAVISAFADGNPPVVTWAAPNRHIDGTVDVVNLTCTSCHGDTATNDPAPPLGTQGETLPSQPAVGAHQQHLNASGWHRNGQCVDCHASPTSMAHSDGHVDFAWGAPANAGIGSNPTFDSNTITCSGVYCHGVTLEGTATHRTPVWNVVDGTYDACGSSCHTLPPGGTHTPSTNCAACHSKVIAAFAPGNPPAVTWADAQLHVNGSVETDQLTCTSCHGDKATNNPAPPLGVNGETLTTQSAVGAHAVHLAAGSTWHRDGQCVDCHTSPSSMTHSNGAVDFSWGLPSSADGMTPSFADATSTCANAYCHGASLQPAKAGGTINRTPIWTKVDGTQDSCGNTCHTNPPGGTHPAHADCTICHKAVIATFVPATDTATWLDRAKHVNGIVESNAYHDLANWTSPKNGTNHHGSNYFLTNQQRDEHNTSCTACHGADLNGGTVGVSCNNITCHKSDWKSCSFCHGTPPSQNNPPLGVGGETTIGTLAVGRHVKHLAGSANYPAVACGTCHQVPAAGDVSHALGYVPTPSLATAGHHGDVNFLAGSGAQGMTWNVNQTQGTPVTARGTCVLGCHSNGRGGNPLVIPYWAGGTWTSGCGNCHQAVPTTNRHDKHVNGENMACTECHPAASSSQHMDGKWSLLGTIHGTVTTIPPGGVCGTHWGCTGTCHGTSHTPECWNQ